MSSTRSKCRHPKKRVKTATSCPASRRKKCSTRGATGSGRVKDMAEVLPGASSGSNAASASVVSHSLLLPREVPGMGRARLAVLPEDPLDLHMVVIGEGEGRLVHVVLGLDPRTIALGAREDDLVGGWPPFGAHVGAIRKHAVVGEREVLAFHVVEGDHLVLRAAEERLEDGVASGRDLVGHGRRS